MQNMNDLYGLDMNLLVVLDALLAERHVTRAALRINKSQPAVSHALARLRLLLNDPVFIRASGRLEPTARALEIAGPLRAGLSMIGSALHEGAFDPALMRRRFRVSMSDYSAGALLPAVIVEVRQQAPETAIDIVALGREAALNALRSGEIDLAVGVYPDLDRTAGGELRSEPLFDDRFVCLCDADCAPPPASLDAYLARPHIAVAASPRDLGDIDAALAAEGRERNIILTLPHWSVAPSLVRGTDLILTAARRSFAAASSSGLAIVDLPFDIAPIPLVMCWHARREADRGHGWLRNLLQTTAAAPVEANRWPPAAGPSLDQ